MSADLVTRRSLLELAVRVAATPVGMQFFAAWKAAAQEHRHTGAPPQTSALHDYQPRFFSPEDFRALEGFTEILIPTDDTPGAREAHCAHYIDFLLNAMTDHAPETQKEWRDALAALKAAGFHEADATRREAIVKTISEPERNHAAHHPAYFAYRLIKRENAFAFYTAREGMIEALDYKGNSYNVVFPACTHPEHHVV